MATVRCIASKRGMAVAVMAVTLVVFATQCVKKMSLPRRDKNFMPVASFVTIFMMMMNMWGAMTWLMGLFNEIVMDNAALELEQPLVQDPVRGQEGDDEEKQLEAPAGLRNKAGVAFHAVTYRVPARRKPILDKVTLHIRPHERVAIVGSIGSGKTTLLRMLMRFREPTSGRIYLDGTDIQDLRLRDLRARVGYANQHPILFDRTILENLLYGTDPTDKSIEARARQLLSEVGLGDAFPSLHASVGKNGGRLSGGQRQIIQLVRTLLWDPEVLVLDEVTTSLDAETKAKLMTLLARMAAGRTVILVSHDDELIKTLAERIVRMDRGRVVSDDANGAHNAPKNIPKPVELPGLLSPRGRPEGPLGSPASGLWL